MVRNRLIDVMMRILLPACFIALKLTGSFIDFMLGLANSNVQEDLNIATSQVRDPRIMSYDSNHIELLVRDNTNILIHESLKTVVEDLLALNGSSAVVDSLASKGTYTLKNLLGRKTVESFNFRTCVKPKLSENRFGDTEIIYESLTAQDLLQKSSKLKNPLMIRIFLENLKFFDASKVCDFR